LKKLNGLTICVSPSDYLDWLSSSNFWVFITV